MSRKLPKGWVEKTVGELGTWKGGGTPSKSNLAYWTNGTIPWVSSKDMKSSRISDAEDKITSAAITESSTNLIPKNSILFVMRSGILKHSLPIALTSNSVTINQDLKALTLFANSYPPAILYMLMSFSPSIRLGCMKSGTTVESIEFSDLKSFPIPFPPVHEQYRIASILDSILPRVEKIRERMGRIPTLVKRFRQSVLTAAVTGKLTERWRAENPGAGDWTETTIGECGLVSGGITKNTKRDELPILKHYLRVANVYANRLELDEISEIRLTEGEYRRTKLADGDLLIVEGNGSVDQVGRVSIWANEIVDCVHQNHLIRWRSSGPAPKYVLFWLISPAGRELITEQASTSSGLHTLSISKISGISISLPPPSEQQEIIKQVDQLFTLADKLEAHYQKAMNRVEKFPQAILAKAFRGELVPQDPSDEPAEKLLERIREERARMDNGKLRTRSAKPEKVKKTRALASAR